VSQGGYRGYRDVYAFLGWTGDVRTADGDEVRRSGRGASATRLSLVSKPEGAEGPRLPCRAEERDMETNAI
jgi:hypothetical protein